RIADDFWQRSKSTESGQLLTRALQQMMRPRAVAVGTRVSPLRTRPYGPRHVQSGDQRELRGCDGHCANFALSRRPGFWMESGQGKRPECNKGQKHNKLGDDKRRL